MPSLIRRVALFLLLLFPKTADAAEPARVTILLHEVPVALEIEAAIQVSWGARIPQPPAAWLQHSSFRRSANRPTGTIELKTETRQIDDEITSFLIYGHIRAGNRIIRYIPAKLYETKDFKSLTQIEIEITPRRTFGDAFLDSYPLEYRNDRGFLNSKNVRPTLRSFRRMIDYAGETNSVITPPVWSRLHSFFQVNSGFFKTGGSDELSDVLRYLKSYAAASRAPGVALFYAEFLNGLVDDVIGRLVFGGEELTDYLHGELMTLYESKLKESFREADNSLEKYRKIQRFEQCLELSEKILRTLTREFLDDAIRSQKRNLFSVLQQTTICGQDHYENSSRLPGASRLDADAGAKFLVESEVGRPALDQFLAVCRVLSSKGLLSLESTGKAGEISKFYLAYNRATEGG